LALLLREAAVNINTFNFFLIFQTNTHFLRVLLGWAHVAGGSKAFWADRLVLQATTKTRQQLWQQQHHSSNISFAQTQNWSDMCLSEEKHIVNGVEHVKQQTGRTTFVLSFSRRTAKMLQKPKRPAHICWL